MWWLLFTVLLLHTNSAPLSLRSQKTSTLLPSCEQGVDCGREETLFRGISSLPATSTSYRGGNRASGYNTMLLPGLATVRTNSSVVMTTEDLRDRLKPGDLIRLGNVEYGVEPADIPPHEGLLTVKAVMEHGILLEKQYKSKTLVQAQILKQILSAEFEIDRVREETRQRALNRLGQEQLERERKLALKISERHLRDAIAQEMVENREIPSVILKSPCHGHKYLSGTFEVRYGSPLVFTSQDVRHEVRVGDVVRFENGETSYAIWFDPRDSRTMTLNRRFEASSNTTIRGCVVKTMTTREVDDVGCVKLQNMCFERLQDDVMSVKREIRDETKPAVMAGETIRFTEIPSFDLETSNRGSFSSLVLNPSNGTSFSLKTRLKKKTSSCLEACLVQNTWSGGLVPLLCGTGSLVRASPVVMTTCDMSMYLSPGDFVRVGTRVSPVLEVTSTSFVMPVRFLSFTYHYNLSCTHTHKHLGTS